MKRAYLPTPRGGWFPIEQNELPHRIEVFAEDDGGGVAITGLRIEPLTTGEPTTHALTLEVLRQLPLRSMKSQAVQHLNGKFPEEVKVAPQKVGRSLPRSHYVEVASYYHLFLDLESRSPVKRIADWWGVPHATAARWVAKARELGLLGVPSHPGVAGDDLPKKTARKKAKAVKKRR